MSTPFRQAEFQHSAYSLAQLLPDEGREIAFAGRSNAGKSTAINRLCGQKNLCKTSKTPGRTQLINFFRIDDAHRLVDLPGYGFAKVPPKLRQHWGQVLSRFLREREALKGVIVIVDARRGLSELDWGLIDLVDPELPVHVLLTKADKLKSGARKKALTEAEKALKPEGITVSLFSATSGLGLDRFDARCREMLGLE